MDPPSEDMELAAVEVTMHWRSRMGQATEVTQARYALDQGERPPDLSVFGRVSRPISSVETMEVPTPVPTRQRRDLSETSDLLPSAETGPLPLRKRGNTEPQAPGEAPLLSEGSELGSFTIIEALGQGGMGVVYKAYDGSLDRHVALKVLAPTLSRNQTFIERFRREAKACGKLSHPNITHIYSISGQDETFHYFAMELVEGENLAERIKRLGPFEPEEALEIVRQTALGLKEAAKAKIIHRDIKPSNLLMTGEGLVKITDFGLAKARASIGHTLDLTSTGVVMGTPIYMSPEQGRGGKVDHRSDIYSLGATLFFLLYGCPPFEADSPIALILKHINEPLVFPATRQVASGIKGLLLRMLEKDLSRRPATYDVLLDDVAKALRGEEVQELGTRVIVLNKRSGGAKPRLKRKKSGVFSSGLKATKLSVARTNIRLGRRGKAMSLLLESVEEGDPALRAEAALLLLSLYEEEGDPAEVRRMAEVVVQDATDPAATAYAAWKLAALDEAAAIAQAKRAIARYEGILKHPPPGFPREVLEAQVARLKTQVQDAVRQSGQTQVVLSEGK